MRKGFFITVEGGEGAGKTTVIERLKVALASCGVPCVITREPGGTSLGNAIRELLLHSHEKISAKSELFLLLAARSQHLEEVIVPAIDSGSVVICDRFNDSTIAYQGYARGLNPSEVEKICFYACQGITADLTLLLDIDPAAGLKRTAAAGAFDNIESEGLAFHSRVREGLLECAKAYRERIIVIDAGGTAEEVFDGCLSIIRERIGF